MNLLCLVGEQPIPNLLPALSLKPHSVVLACTTTTRRVAHNLQPMFARAAIHEVSDYDIPAAIRQLKALCTRETVINLTAGTKLMALAAYETARSLNLPFVYLSSQGNTSLLHHFEWDSAGLRLASRQELPGLITIQDYLKAHGLYPESESGPQNAQESGLLRTFEKLVDECRSNLLFEAFEIDFLLRRGNQVAVVEAKMTSRNTRKGIDQLNTIAGRAYLGTYTGKIWIVTKPLGKQLTHLAEARQIRVIHVSGQIHRQTGRLVPDQASRQRIEVALDAVLGPRRTP